MTATKSLSISFCALIFVLSLSANTHKKPLTIAYWSSWQVPCGIAVYTKHLVNALIKQQQNVIIYPHTLPPEELILSIKRDRPDILVINYISVLFRFPHCYSLKQHITRLITLFSQIQKMGSKIVITAHEEPWYMPLLALAADHCVYHKPSRFFFNQGKITVFPMGVPVFIPRTNRTKLRTQYGFTPNQKILATAGFALAWKELPACLELLVPFLKKDPTLHIQLLTSNNHIASQESLHENNALENIIKKYNLEKKITHITEFVPQQELNERLWISDLGYLWSAQNSTASSASGKEYIASRLPSVTTNSSHYHDMTVGVVKTAPDKKTFIKTIGDLIQDPKKLHSLRQELEKEYQERNYDTIITFHKELFKKILTQKEPSLLLFR